MRPIIKKNLLETLVTYKVSLVSLPQKMDTQQENKKRIAEKALELFIMYGIRSVSMDVIATSLGMSKKTIYNYYTDKDGLVLDVVQRVLNKNCQDNMADEHAAKNAVQESFMAIERTSELFSSMNPVVMFDLEKYHPRAYKVFVNYKQDFLYNALKKNIEDGIKDGLYRADLNVELIVRFRLQTVLLAFIPEMHADTGLAKTNEELFYLFLYGLSTPKGYQFINKYRKERLKF